MTNKIAEAGIVAHTQHSGRQGQSLRPAGPTKTTQRNPVLKRNHPTTPKRWKNKAKTSLTCVQTGSQDVILPAANWDSPVSEGMDNVNFSFYLDGWLYLPLYLPTLDLLLLTSPKWQDYEPPNQAHSPNKMETRHTALISALKRWREADLYKFKDNQGYKDHNLKKQNRNKQATNTYILKCSDNWETKTLVWLLDKKQNKKHKII